MKTLYTVLISTILLTGLSACNTLQGAGQDLENAGEGLEEATD